MIRTIKGQLSLALSQIIGNFILVLGGGLFGTMLFEIIMRLTVASEENPTTFEMAFLMGLVVYVIVSFIWGIAYTEQYFNNIVGMGRTRKSFFIGYTLTTLLTAFSGIIALYLIYITEHLRLRLWWSEYPCETNFAVFFTPAIFCWIAVMLCILQEFWGFLILRFGKKAFWALWAICMILSLGIPRIRDDITDGRNSVLANFGYQCLNLYQCLPLTVWLLILSGIGLILFAVTYYLFQRQKVTF